MGCTLPALSGPVELEKQFWVLVLVFASPKGKSIIVGVCCLFLFLFLSCVGLWVVVCWKAGKAIFTYLEYLLLWLRRCFATPFGLVKVYGSWLITVTTCPFFMWWQCTVFLTTVVIQRSWPSLLLTSSHTQGPAYSCGRVIQWFQIIPVAFWLFFYLFFYWKFLRSLPCLDCQRVNVRRVVSV